MVPIASDRDGWQGWMAAGIAAIATVAAFSGALDNEFVDYDDWGYVFDPRTLDGLTATNIFRAFTESILGNYHPVAWLSHMVDVQLFGLDPRGHHAVSVGFHALNASLVVVLLRTLGVRPWFCLGLSLLYALHPLRVESVAWISERKDVLCGTFYLLTLVMWCRPLEGRGRLQLPTMLCVVGALLSKPMAVSLPLVMFLHDVVAQRESLQRALVRVLPYATLAAVLAVVTIGVQNHAPPALYPLTLRLQTAAVAQVRFYLGNTIAPDCLHAPYVYPEAWPPSQVAMAFAVLALVAGAAFRCRDRWPLTTFGIALWAVAMLPVSGLVAVGNVPAADRYTYIPTIGLLVAAVPFVVWLDASMSSVVRRAAFGAVVMLAGGLMVVSRQQVSVWRNTETLFSHAVACEPTNPLALAVLAKLDMVNSDHRAAQRKLAIATEAWPNYVDGWAMRGVASLAQLEYGRARDEFIEVLSYQPRDPLGHLGLSLSLAALGDGAAAHHEFAMVDFSDFREQYALEGIAAGFERLGDAGRAAVVRKAIKFVPFPGAKTSSSAGGR